MAKIGVITKKWATRQLLLPTIVAESISYSEVCRKLGLGTAGGNPRHVRKHVERLKLNTSHFCGAAAALAAFKVHRETSKSLEELLVENSTVRSYNLKKKLLAKGLFENECACCGSPPVWKGKPLVLQLEHKNGIHSDCRFYNLELLCPNCHSQTTTFCGKNKKVNKVL